MTTFRLFLTLFVSLAIISCQEAVIDDPQSTDYSTVLEHLSKDVILQTYNDLATQAENLNQSAIEFELNPTLVNLDNMKESWKATRAPWELSEGFLFGPVDTEGIDPAIDSWPVNKTDLDNVLASGDNLTPSFIASLEGTLKGFHTIEYLLWSEDGTKEVEDFTDREMEYLIACSQVLADDTKTLFELWDPSVGGFINEIMNAGEVGSIYVSQKAAVEELTNGLLTIADEVGNGKINDPLEQEDYTLEESQFSDNSKIDFAHNIMSIQNIYNGMNDMGISEIIQEENAEVDAQIRMEIQDAIDAILAIPGTFTDAIDASSSTRVYAEEAQAAVRTLQFTIESKLIPIVSNL